MFHLRYVKKPKHNDKVIAIVKGIGKHRNLFIALRNEEGNQEIRVDKKEFIEPVLSDEMQRVFIFGESGSGKSTLASLFVKNSLDPAYIVSAKHGDPVFKNLDDVKYVKIDRLIEYPIKYLSEWKYSTFVFDDIQFPSKEIDKKILRQRDYLLNLGRSKHINVICSSWAFTGVGNPNKYALLQAQAISFFPSVGDVLPLINYLKARGRNKEQIKEIVNQKNTRWAILIKNPLCVITQKHVKLY